MKYKYKIPEMLDNLYFLPSEIVWLEDDIKKLMGYKDDRWNVIIELESTRLCRCKDEMQAALEIISAVDDPMLRPVLEMRYLHGMGWQKIARAMPGTMSVAGYRKMCSRWVTRLEVKENERA